MAKRDPRVDAYIARSPDFARPILERIRSIVHEACPAAEETLKWSMPTFMYHGMLCGVGAFKQHCTFGFWKHSLVVPDNDKSEGGMGQFGRITRVSDLPSKKVLTGYIRTAMKLNEDGVTVKRRRTAKKPLPVPADLRAALLKSAKARKWFESIPPSHRREYIEWITEARREETRKRRLATTIEWLSQGKSRNWKYESR
jgi:uncharacterized protein YdeI (YjbR/CyaY-like superfamily)